MDDLVKRLRERLEKATPGTLIHHGWGDGSTEMGMTNIFNEDADVLLMECIPEHDASLIVDLRNSAPALLDEIEALRAELARVRALGDAMAGALDALCECAEAA